MAIAASEGHDIVIIKLHAGCNYQELMSPLQRQLFIMAGAYGFLCIMITLFTSVYSKAPCAGFGAHQQWVLCTGDMNGVNQQYSRSVIPSLLVFSFSDVPCSNLPQIVVNR